MFTNPTLLALYAEARHQGDLALRRHETRRTGKSEATSDARRRSDVTPSVLAVHSRRPS